MKVFARICLLAFTGLVVYSMATHWLAWRFGMGDWPVPQGTPWTYQLWSGMIPGLTVATLFGAVLASWHLHNCHHSTCWRLGKHRINGTPWCTKHEEEGRAYRSEEITLQDVLAAVQAGNELRKETNDYLHTLVVQGGGEAMSFYARHKLALRVIAASLLLDAVAGLVFSGVEHIAVWHGLYDELANAVTLGGDVQPQHPLGYLVNTFVCFTVIPMFAATISLFTAGVTAGHVEKSENRIKTRLDRLHVHVEQATGCATPVAPPHADS